MKISFSFTEMGREKCKILNFHVLFLNKDISIIVADIIPKILYVSSSYPSRGILCNLEKESLKNEQTLPVF